MTLKAGEALFILAGTIHAAKNVGTGNAAELAMYRVPSSIAAKERSTRPQVGRPGGEGALACYERDGGTLYNTQLLFDADGTLIQRRRKITRAITSA